MLKFGNEIIFCFHTSFCILTELVVQRQILTETHLWLVTITMQVLREDLLY